MVYFFPNSTAAWQIMSQCSGVWIAVCCLAVFPSHSFSLSLGLLFTELFFFLLAIRQLQVNPPISILFNFTMLMLLIHTYTPCVDYSPCQANVFSTVIIMCLVLFIFFFVECHIGRS